MLEILDLIEAITPRSSRGLGVRPSVIGQYDLERNRPLLLEVLGRQAKEKDGCFRNWLLKDELIFQYLAFRVNSCDDAKLTDDVLKGREIDHPIIVAEIIGERSVASL